MWRAWQERRQCGAIPSAAPPVTVDHEQLYRDAMEALHRQRAEAQAIDVLKRSIDTAQHSVRWQQAQRMAAQEVGVSDGLVYWERVRQRFIELGAIGPDLQHAAVPVATVPHDDALTPADEAVAARLLGWLVDG